MLLLPVERALLPLVEEADDQNAEEDHHRPEARRADLLERHRPREKERDLEIEQDEQNRDEVVAHVELHARVFERLEAAFVGGILRGVRLVRTQQETEHLRRYAYPYADQDEQDDGQVGSEVHGVV